MASSLVNPDDEPSDYDIELITKSDEETNGGKDTFTY